MKIAVSIFVYLIFSIKCSIFNSDQDTRITLINSVMAEGIHQCNWNQQDDKGSFVNAGKYQTVIITSGFSKSIDFEISSTAKHIEGSQDSDSNKSENSELNKNSSDFDMVLNSKIYALGDTVRIKFKMPKKDKVKLWIEPK